MVEVRVYPTSYGWFGWTVDKVLRNPDVSEDRRMWTYQSDPLQRWTGPIMSESMLPQK